jgi:hypothetical protein
MNGAAAAGGRTPPLSGRQRWQIAGLTAGALGAWLAFRFLAGPPALSPMDFVVGGDDALQFCDPNRPQFLPVVTRTQPITLRMTSPQRLVLTTATGKAVGPRDLARTDGVPFRLFVVNRELTEFFVADPVASETPGEWLLDRSRPSPSAFRGFADLTPVAIGREIYASADLLATQGSAAVSGPAAASAAEWSSDLQSTSARIFARQPVVLTLSMGRRDGRPLELTPIGGVRAHLVAFDQACTGMVHLRSNESAANPAGQTRAQATFSVTFPDSGTYVLWSEVELNGRIVSERFVREVMP